MGSPYPDRGYLLEEGGRGRSEKETHLHMAEVGLTIIQRGRFPGGFSSAPGEVCRKSMGDLRIPCHFDGPDSPAPGHVATIITQNPGAVLGSDVTHRSCWTAVMTGPDLTER